METGLTVLEEIVGEVSHEPAGKRRQARNCRHPVGLQDGPKGFQGLFGIHRDPAAGKFHLGVPVLGPDPGNGIEPDEGIPAGLIVLFQAFQQEVPAAFFPYQAHQTDGGGRIRQDFPDHRHRRISLGQGFDFFQTLLFHLCSSLLTKEKVSGLIIPPGYLDCKTCRCNKKHLSSYKDRCHNLRYHPVMEPKPHTSSRMPTHSSPVTSVLRRGILSEDFIAPSVVHLSDCHDPALSFPDSLCAHFLALSPPQRFLVRIELMVV